MRAQEVAYIGHREFSKDVTYGTGEWVKGQTKVVDGMTALKLSRHPDVYRILDRSDVVLSDSDAITPTKQVEDEVIESQYAIDTLQRMDREALCEFVKHNFQQKLDKRKSVETLRNEAVNLVHQFGTA
jgi:hypothetical protein